jgi:hypothetical protein
VAKALEELDAEIKIARKKAEQRAAPLPKKVSLYGGVSPNDRNASASPRLQPWEEVKIYSTIADFIILFSP